MLELEELLKEVISWCKEIGKLQVEKMNSNLDINTKSVEIDLVTEMDELSEELLIKKIKNNYNEHSILSEESGEEDLDSDYRWIIDPIDGTTNYASGFLAFCISIALEFKGETVLGVVYAPKIDELYYAIKGKGAFLNGEKIEVSSTESLKDSLLTTGFYYDKASASDNNLDNFCKMITKVRGIRRTGSAAFELANVAAGVFDGHWESKLNLWDVAAGFLLVKEAGGKVISSQTEKGINFIAGNKGIVKQLLPEVNIKL